MHSSPVQHSENQPWTTKWHKGVWFSYKFADLNVEYKFRVCQFENVEGGGDDIDDDACRQMTK